MTVLALFVPLLAGATVALVATAAHHRLPPHLAARFITLSLALVMVGALPTALVLAASFLIHVPLVGAALQWCAHTVGFHATVSAWVGVPAVVLVGVGSVRIARVLRQHRSVRCDCGGPVQVAADQRPFAVTLPGRGGQIVMSSGLIDLLGPDETDVVLAHEHAHARLRHDRYLLVLELSATALPPVRPLARWARFSVERWPDEAAAAACGSRRLVAETVGKVALFGHPTAGVLGFAGNGVGSRVSALLRPPVPAPRAAGRAALFLAAAGTAVASAYQIHHLGVLVAAMCLN